ncbi:ABC transporter ATP-binding protein [Pseudobacteriovorax antillogorgiicola]|uniref:ABC-2 type transport system ATP-binding protein n=1 Tax=Pseudobacteriovorax antillogorgiicola TaxID=1513793 RepID=A0A1Y6BMW8_9BACT|nr:ABC transporter ATP-binding protein [Pseudobacteriovorax antillogorgiicola]TCS55478.1 ABC-2 type transport system ATP-binding protein [Pseudobacteriovorax antillogorgiicola]SMF11963.1 ABC-2 type transport system ATP-binding protein [Pseudobacteriovorax antillogorgiicola]
MDQSGRLPYLCFSNVFKSYGRHQALRNFSFKIKSGERVALLGINGAGKSTLVNLATGLRHHDRGTIQLFDGSPQQRKQRRQLGYLAQEVQYPVFLKVHEVIETIASHFPKPFLTVLDQLDIHSLMDKKIGGLSGGQHRRVALACSLLGEPRLALLDEPTGGMDIAMRNQTFDVLREYFSKEERSVLFSTHHMDEVDKLADRVIVIHEGEIVTEGSVADIKETYGLRAVLFESRQKDIQLFEARNLKCRDHSWRAYGTDSDRLLREVIAKVPDASGLRVLEPSLEDIFMTLTGNPS